MAIITGTNGSDNSTTGFIGSPGDDELNALGGDDILDGGSGGLDTLRGGSGDDTYIIDDQGVNPDVIEEFEQFEDPADTGTTGGTDTVESARDYDFLGTYLENLTLTGTALFGGGNNLDNRVIGNDRNNILNGFDGADTLEGGAGKDVLHGGGGGIDSLKGGSGDDRYVVTNSSDIITELVDEGEDKVQSHASSYTLSANVENLELIGTNNINGTGNSGNNEIIGNIAILNQLRTLYGAMHCSLRSNVYKSNRIAIAVTTP